jgi:hypothetical protein
VSSAVNLEGMVRDLDYLVAELWTVCKADPEVGELGGGAGIGHHGPPAAKNDRESFEKPHLQFGNASSTHTRHDVRSFPPHKPTIGWSTLVRRPFLRRIGPSRSPETPYAPASSNHELILS